MSLEETLARAARDEAEGDLGKARDRLEGLLVAYPENMVIRRRLGEIYWRLCYPERAGRNWFLLPTDRPEMDTAKAVFEARYGHNPWLMLDAIGYRGGLEAVHGSYAEERLRALALRARIDYPELERLRYMRPRPEMRPRPKASPARMWDAWLALAAILLVVLAILALIGVGIWTVVMWL